MRKGVLLLTTAVLLGAIAFVYAGIRSGVIKLGVKPFVSVCWRDDEIDAATRAEITSASMSFAQKIISRSAETAYPAMTEEVKKSIPRAEFATTMNKYVAAAGAFQNLKPKHVYLLSVMGSGPETRIVCGELHGDQWVSLSAKPGQKQAHVELSAETRNNGWALTSWLIREPTGWHIQYFALNVSSMAGITPEKMLKQAREELKDKHIFNTQMLYAGAQGMIGRGPAFQLSIAPTLEADLKNFKSAPELSGAPPFKWRMNKHTYTVRAVTITGIGGKIGLIFVLPQSTWPSDQEIQARSRAFLDDFRATHPEYKKAFAFLVARAMKPDDSGGFGTVFEDGKGYN